ncbi:MAG: phosphate signaling complex protein PhoU [Gammaproteobacteria bacterium]|nr:phosphate signaling complex protein PhoU [Gammaproteobacteria bacterium]
MTAEGPTRHFDQELDALRSLLLEMSGLAEDQVAGAHQAMLGGDTGRADEVIELDLRVDALELQIDKVAHELLALQQPMAGDLRLVTMTMRISNDLERVGDHAVNVAREVRRSGALLSFARTPEVAEMARIGRRMLSDVLDSFVRSDAVKAREVIKADAQVDRLYNSVFRILLTHMLEDPRRIGPAMSLLLISRNLERIGDLATNIAEDVVFMVEGVDIRHPPKRER